MQELIFTDEQIEALLKMPKMVINPGARWKLQRGANQKNFDLESEDRTQFSLYLRQNMRIANNFSCGLLLKHPQGNITLTRYNGSDHDHENPLDFDTRVSNTCHIHVATARYMNAGRKPEHYAVNTDRYTDLDGALRALIFDCAVSGVKLKESDIESADTQTITGDLFT